MDVLIDKPVATPKLRCPNCGAWGRYGRGTTFFCRECGEIWYVGEPDDECTVVSGRMICVHDVVLE